MLESGTRLSLALAATLLLLSLLILARLLVYPLVHTYWSGHQALSEKSAILERYQSLMNDIPLFEQQLTERQGAAKTGTFYLTGPTHALAGAELQDKVRKAIITAGSDIESTEMLPVVSKGDTALFSRIGLKVRFSTSTESLGDILHGLESTRPFLSFSKLVVTKRSQDVPIDETEHAKTIDVSFDIFGLLRN